MKNLTAMELWDELGHAFMEVKIATNATARREALENAEYMAKIAKQMSNMGDLILRTDKMVGNTDRINAIIGEKK